MILSGVHFGQRRLLPSLSSRRQPFATARRMVSTTSNNKEKKEKVILISGPTGAGKSRLALELAKRLNGEIISADSVYRGLDIGSAKPPPSDRKEVQHHLVDILDPFEDYSVGQFFEDARQTTRDVLDSGHARIVTGGTGLYLRWFVYGKPNVPKASTEIAAKVHAEIADFERDGEWDAAVEMIIKSTGSPPSAFHIPYDSFKQQFDSSGTNDSHNLNPSRVVPEQVTAKELDYEFICFFLSSPRLDLYRLIDLRCEEMLTVVTDGMLSEARWLLDLGFSPNSNSATGAIGYRHISSMIEIEVEMDFDVLPAESASAAETISEQIQQIMELENLEEPYPCSCDSHMFSSYEVEILRII
ncbi:hypothetical protein SLA2020_211420 [Shorea laevis]